MVNAVKEGLSDRKMDKEANAEENDTKEMSATEAEELAAGAVIKGAKEEEETGGAKKPRRRVIAKK
jgi:hypothetical protein